MCKRRSSFVLCRVAICACRREFSRWRSSWRTRSAVISRHASSCRSLVIIVIDSDCSSWMRVSRNFTRSLLFRSASSAWSRSLRSLPKRTFTVRKLRDSCSSPVLFRNTVMLRAPPVHLVVVPFQLLHPPHNRDGAGLDHGEGVVGARHERVALPLPRHRDEAPPQVAFAAAILVRVEVRQDAMQNGAGRSRVALVAKQRADAELLVCGEQHSSVRRVANSRNHRMYL